MNHIFCIFCFPVFIIFRLIDISQGNTLEDILNIPRDIENYLMDLYRPARENRLSIPPEVENSTMIASGLPGTHFQTVLEQNIGDMCYPLAEFHCNSSQRYRSINGSCNNLGFPMWGLTGAALVRLVPASYQDGLHQPRLSVSGRALPNPRQLRNILLPNRDMPDHINTRIVMEWGQIISHDTTHISTLPVSSLGGLQCCANNQYPEVGELPAECMPIQVAPDDPYFSQYNQTCLNFVRAVTTTDYGCSLVPQQQLAMVTHFVDASWVYGSTDNVADRLREREGGRLTASLTPDGREFPPSTMHNYYCGVPSNNESCFYGGDIRMNQNTDVTMMHILFFREHNKICRELSAINTHWDDERLYQEARRIVIASVQRITYSDFLIVMLGRNYSSSNRMLDYDFTQLYPGYEFLLNPTSINDFTATAYRSFHNLIPSTMELTEENRCPRGSLLLSDWFFRPSVIERPGNYDSLIRGLATQRSNKFDNYFSAQVTDKLFRLLAPFGSDLAAVDIQRSRDQGIAPYNAYRVACGLPRANNFSDFRDVINETDINLLEQNYEDVNDVEFYVAGLMERHAEGALTGPTFQCILGEQFTRWRNGDRFYYQFSNQSGSFTPEQYRELEKLRLSLIFCRNSDNVHNIQPNVFYRPSTSNRLVPCSSLPELNFEPWRESR